MRFHCCSLPGYNADHPREVITMKDNIKMLQATYEAKYRELRKSGELSRPGNKFFIPENPYSDCLRDAAYNFIVDNTGYKMVAGQEYKFGEKKASSSVPALGRKVESTETEVSKVCM